MQGAEDHDRTAVADRECVGGNREGPQMNALLRLRDEGQSVWLDFLRRSLITAGGLQRLVRKEGVSGVTSNPSIFGKASAAPPTTTKQSGPSPTRPGGPRWKSSATSPWPT